MGACGNITKLHSRADLAPYCTLHTNELVIGVIWEAVVGMCVGSPLSCNPGPIRAIFLHWHIHLICGHFGLSSLQHNPVGNHVTGTAFIGIDFSNETVLVLFKKNSWFLCLGEK